MKSSPRADHKTPVPPILWPLLAYVPGVVVGQSLGLEPFPAGGIFLLLGLSLALTVSRQTRAATWALQGACFLLGAAASPPERVLELHGNPGLDSRQPVRLEGRVEEVSRLTRSRTRVLLDSQRQCTEAGCIEVRGLVRLYLEGPAPSPGWILRCSARLSRIEPSGNPDSGDPRISARREGILRQGTVTTWIRLQSSESPSPLLAMLELRERLRQRLREYYLEAPPDVRGLLLGLALGERTELEAGQRELFSSAGLAHLLAISGSHFALIASVVGTLFAWPILLVPALNRRLSARGMAAWLALAPTITYALLVGISASIGRAITMTSLALAMAGLGRRVGGPALLTLAGWAVLTVAPKALWDVGTQLSFASVLTLLTLAPRLQGAAEGVLNQAMQGAATQLPALNPIVRLVREGLLLVTTSLAATIGTAPLCAFHFGCIPWAGILANVLAVPLLGAFSLPPLLVGGVLHLIGLPGADGCLALGTWIVRPGLEVAAFFGDPSTMAPLYWQPSLPQTGALLLIALGLCLPSPCGKVSHQEQHGALPREVSLSHRTFASLRTILLQTLSRGRISILGAALLLACSPLEQLELERLELPSTPGGILEQALGGSESRSSSLPMPRSATLSDAAALPTSAALPTLAARPLRWTQLNVGQGDGAVLELPSGEVMLVDAGGATSSGGSDPGKRVVLPFLRSRGIQRIEIMVLTHPHPDHMGGLLAVADALPVGELWIAERPDRTGDFQTLVEQLEARGTSIREVSTDSTLEARGDVHMTCLHPSPDWPTRLARKKERTANNASLVLQLSYGEVDILLTGDIERPVEEMLASDGRLQRVEVVKVPHHGSNTSSTDALVQATRPRAAVMGVGRDNRFDFPRTSVVRRWAAAGAQIFRTDLDGAVELTLFPDRLQVMTWHPDRQRQVTLLPLETQTPVATRTLEVR